MSPLIRSVPSPAAAGSPPPARRTSGWAAVWTLLCAALLAIALLAGTPSDAAAKGCGTVSADYVDGMGGSGVKIVSVRGVSCKQARSLVKQCIRRKTVKGWSPGADASRTPLRESLFRGSKRITWVGVAGGGPTCTQESVQEALSESS